MPGGREDTLFVVRNAYGERIFPAGLVTGSTIMKIRGVQAGLIDLMCRIGEEQHPHEFAALLREEEGIITELILVPGTTSGEDHASVFLDMMPLDSHLAGSAHSHPNGVILPSDADLSFFSRSGRCHFIIGYPYSRESWGCFRTDGSRYDIEVVP